ncbi:MAG TPA: prepilin-type N-terminal cleavage/methylation domain-containing protein [Planctomycetota bacterium]|nr:prepilin-type N-terminal cleavage/methylation domain-containing protein [Planctomycetota bacterium]
MRPVASSLVPSPPPALSPRRRVAASPRPVIRGFTLVEILTVVAIIAVLLGLTVWTVSGMRRTAKHKAARADLAALKGAIERYRETYGAWPDRMITDPKGPLKNFEIVRLLRNWKIDVPLSDSTGRDPKFNRDPMLEKLDTLQLDKDGNWRDPWGTPYAISMVPDQAYRAYEKLAASPAGSPPVLTPDETAAIQAYGATTDHALYWVKIVKGPVNVYSLGPDTICDWGYCFGDGSGYIKGPWKYCSAGDLDSTATDKRGDDVRVDSH